MRDPAAALTAWFVDRGVQPGDLVGLAVAPGVGIGVAATARPATTGDHHEQPAPATASRAYDMSGLATDDLAGVIERVSERFRPRWVVWSNATASVLADAGVRLATCWDLAAVHRLLCGGWRADPALVWAEALGLRPEDAPVPGPPDLFSHGTRDAGDQDDPVGADGYLRPEWIAGRWSANPTSLGRWAARAVEVADLQRARVHGQTDRPAAPATARSESTASSSAVELSADGLPMDRSVVEAILAGIIGPRQGSQIDVDGDGAGSHAAGVRARRDEEVLRHVPPGLRIDLRSPAQVRQLLISIGVDVPDTRAWRLEARRGDHPLIGPLLAWRRAERIATTYSYAWLDAHLGPDGRLRGTWTGSDGAAGRMTASGGLHNMPAMMRPAVAAEPGYVFVRADLGQIEPRVLAAVSGDAALARAGQEDDMYAPVAAQLGVDRETAKVAVLGAMYGQTTGHGARALVGLEAAYPVAMRYLDEADRAGRSGRNLRTYGGRVVRMDGGRTHAAGSPAAQAQSAGRGRYGRNAVVQGAAAELFKMWAVTVRARVAPLGARIVLCLHDELLVHVPGEHGPSVAELVDRSLDEAAGRWAPDDGVRFISDTALMARWSDAKPTVAPDEVRP
jgi:DNA polymerase-1